jgi:hypothetical protein
MMLSRCVGLVRISALAALLSWTLAGGGYAAQSPTDLTPESTPEITDFTPKQAAIDEELTLVIEGKNFAPGVYVSFSTPLVHAVATKRLSTTKLEVALLVGKKAQPDVISLYVSNTASVAAEAPFKIVAQGGPTAAPPSSNLAASAPPSPAKAEPASKPAVAPEVSRVDPPTAPRGGQMDLKITGKNFVKGAKVAFANPGIRVLETQVSAATELVARIQIAANAAPGETNLFVVNPDEEEAEAPFVLSEEVATTPVAAAPGASAAPPAQPSAPAQSAVPGIQPAAAKAAAEPLRFEVYGLADVGSILQARNAPKGTLTLEGDKLRYEESGKEVFAVAAADIKEIEINTLLGVNTGTFHVILNSGKTYNFAASSLRPGDTQSIVDSLRHARK